MKNDPITIEDYQGLLFRHQFHKQYDGILQMIGMILDGCKDLEEAKQKITELREGKKEKPTE